MIITINKKKLLNSIFGDSENLVIEITNVEELQSVFKPTDVTKGEPKWKFSNSALEKLASPEFENTILTVYPDESGQSTIGAGHLLTKSELSSGKIIINGESIQYLNGLTKKQAEDLLLQDLIVYEKSVNDSVTVPLTQPQYDALVMFCFNIGEGGFEGSTCLKLLNNKKYDKVPEQMRRWNKITKNGTLMISQGLINRREKEVLIWMDDYA